MVHRQAWQEHGVQDTWPRVIALVVQSGVVFDHTKVIDYAPARWMTCMAWSSKRIPLITKRPKVPWSEMVFAFSRSVRA
ncbi:MAG: hypothetical protein CBCREVIR_2626 [Candidatus Burkholderia crenata]|nr:MAG: hypothetical protein CBCREVIR_2626 [Candidatus Burkholderia crenata]